MVSSMSQLTEFIEATQTRVIPVALTPSSGSGKIGRKEWDDVQ